MMVWDACRLSGEAAAWRRRGALEALGPLIRLLGGKAFSRSGIHQPLLNEASLSMSHSSLHKLQTLPVHTSVGSSLAGTDALA